MDESRRRRSRDLDIPRRRVAAAARPGRGYSAPDRGDESRRRRDVESPRRRVAATPRPRIVRRPGRALEAGDRRLAGLGHQERRKNHQNPSRRYLDQRAAAARRKLHADVHERLLDFLRASGRLGDAGDDASATLALSELPDELRSALATLDARVADDLEPIGGAKHELQALLDAETHDARCDAFCGIVRRERGRLAARKSLRKLFGEPGVFADTVPLPEGWRFDDDDDDDDVSSSGYQFS